MITPVVHGKVRHDVHPGGTLEVLSLLGIFPANLVVDDEAKFDATIDQAAWELTYCVGWAVATCRQPSTQGGYQIGTALIARWIDH